MGNLAPMESSKRSGPIVFRPLTPARWKDLVTLFGPRGACAGCWCMWFRLRRSEWSKGKGAANRRALRRVVERGPAPGVLAYEGKRPVGWCAIAPREEYSALQRSRSLKPVDNHPVWSVTCFYVARDWRRRGLTARLLEAACAYAKRRGATIAEGYPVVPKQEYPAAWMYVGVESAFAASGFKVVARPSRSRSIVRRTL